ncbi:D-alanyl-D-alanine carboxypeptidase family protein [Thalassobacillus pellis]|uniref:D-alanyl-D-alanine carboxypeptidase family protein n=1 Tax=Thalassobacillus pellis TaxID=748008 RepID=UPI0019616B92|nr:D-alanyl-D-alanine carboxypeptidase family protein [Thalassobacillus pellis]MBM7551406.1 D-alanyl-D-alanine carboxypeptidase/D-alanyl-D-alanine carboxypeptidase (penicillin-binding protein 5/6) [Thalassobacillus pellis]
MKKYILLIIAAITVSFFPQQINAEEDSLSLDSETAILIDAKTGKVLYEKDSRKIMYPASITKIITGIIAIEKGNLNEMVTVSSNARNVSGTTVYLLEGEQVPLKKLIQGMIINSGNDAAVAIAEHIAGDVESFSAMMNDFVVNKVGVTKSHFVNPHGLFNINHYTTAYDMAKIAKYAMKNQIFKEIASTKTLEWKGKGWETTLINHNKMFWRYEGVTGIKSGWVGQSGYTLVTSAERKGTSLIAVVLNSQTAERSYSDAVKLFNYGFENFETSLIAKGSTFQSAGRQYTLPKDYHFTKPKHATITKEVTRSGALLLKAYPETLDKIKLIPLAQGRTLPKSLSTTYSQSVQTDTYFHWLADLFTSQ